MSILKKIILIKKIKFYATIDGVLCEITISADE